MEIEKINVLVMEKPDGTKQEFRGPEAAQEMRSWGDTPMMAVAAMMAGIPYVLPKGRFIIETRETVSYTGGK